MTTGDGKSYPKICVIGAGFSGIIASIRLQNSLDLKNVDIFEMNEDVGGTWYSNCYPGSSCDIPIHAYCITFEARADWKRQYATQEDILVYLREVADKYDIYPKIRFEHKVKRLSWVAGRSQWDVVVENLKTGSVFTNSYDFVLTGTGSLRYPNIPTEFLKFSGEIVHTAMWDRSVELEGKRVAVVGTGASAIQVVPEVAAVAKNLVVYQRKPLWVCPKVDFNFNGVLQFLFRYVPFLLTVYRFILFSAFEMLWYAMTPDSWAHNLATWVCNRFRRRQLEGRKDLYEKLSPDFRFGCKRTGFASNYYPTFLRPNVKLEVSPIETVTGDSILTAEGEEKFDVLVLATGFKVADYFAPMEIYDKKGREELKKWKEDGPNLFLGIATNDLPNLFVIYGPNTSTGHNSVVKTIEMQMDWVVACLKETFRRKAKVVAVKEDVVRKYMTQINSKMSKMVWSASACSPWYADEKGRITGIYPEQLRSYAKRVARFNPAKELEFR